ncbi:MAG: S41 family peptidase [Acidobacteriota bacterium]
MREPLSKQAGALLLAVLASFPAVSALADEAGPVGYYRFPAIHQDTIVFTAEGDLWRVGIQGGAAQRLTTHAGSETHPAISPDGTRVAFSAEYEGAAEVYVMPLAGGLPRRLTYEGDQARVVGWASNAEVLYATRHFATLPNLQLVRLDAESGARRRVPLEQAAEGVFEPSSETAGETLFFTRQQFQGSHTKRYRGGTAQNLWRFTTGDAEAVPLTADFPGTSREPMWWRGRVAFLSDRDGTMNLWSMDRDGGDLQQHTQHAGWDVKSPAIWQDLVVYQLGADLHVVDLASGEDRALRVTLATDFDQQRERWIDEPMDYLTAAHLSPDGGHVVLTARGQVFVVPVKQGRWVEAGRPDGVRFRGARFLPTADAEAAASSLVALSDESGEVEVWRLDARGVEPREQLTEGGKELRFDVYPSPDGSRVAYTEKDHELWIVELATGSQTRVAQSRFFGFRGIAWSQDSRWLAYGVPADNFMGQIRLHSVETESDTAVTSDRFNSFDPAWSPEGDWLYFLSDRHLVSLADSPWGLYQPQPFLDGKAKIYQVALRKGLRSPFAPVTELAPEPPKPSEDEGGKRPAKPRPERIEIELEGLSRRLWEVPVPPGNLAQLSVTSERLYWLATDTTVERSQSLKALAIGRDEPEVISLASGVSHYELSADCARLLLRQGDHLFVIEAGGEPVEDFAEHKVELAGWTFPLDPREEWTQMFRDGWRLLRDYFYDPGMHGVDWPAMYAKYAPLVDRISDRAELSDLLAELTGELSTLHHFVSGGDHREGDDDIAPAFLGAVLELDAEAGGHRVVSLYSADPDLPQERSPLDRPGVDVGVGDVVLGINGVATSTVTDVGQLLRHQAGRQVLLRVRDGASGEEREVIVEPLTWRQALDLRYVSWEYERRLRVDAASENTIGYVHLKAMGRSSYSEWARHYFPVFQRQGLIIDVRHNRGGNIDSWILGSLLRRPWMWWKPRSGDVYRNMQFSYGGHLVVLVDERTASDGEAFAEGFRRLGLGKVIGTRTWGGEIWLTSSNVLVDRGIATAGEFGVYGPEGEWLIEGHGVEPDIVVDNLPHATFHGGDAQLDAAIEHLKQLIRDDPPIVPEPPPYPDKSFIHQ